MPNTAAREAARIEADHPGARPSFRHRTAVGYVRPDGKVVAAYSTGPIHWSQPFVAFDEDTGPVTKYEWAEIDTDLEDRPDPTWLWGVRSAEYDTTLTAAGGRRFYPRRLVPGEWVEFGPVEYQRTNGQWRAVAAGVLNRLDNRAYIDTAAYTYEVGFIGTGSRTTLTLKDSTFARPIRWKVTLNGLLWSQGKLVSVADAQTVGYIRQPTWTDAARPDPQPIQPDYAGGYLTVNPDFTGAVYPVVIDPDYSVVAGADDGYVYGATPPNTIDATGTGLGWGRSPSNKPNDTFCRWTGIVAANGDNATVAYIRFTSSTANTGTVCRVRIYLDDEASAVLPAAPTTAAEYLAKPLTTAYADWTVQGWGAGGYEQDSPDISALFDEVFALAGWATGQAVQALIYENGSDIGATRAPASYENASYTEPILYLVIDGHHPYIAGAVAKSAQDSDTTSHVVTLPAGCTAGEQILILGGMDNSAAGTIATPAGWRAASVSTVTSARCIAAYWKTSDGTEGGTTVTITSSAAEQSRWMAYRIANCGGIISNRRTAATGSSSPDPPSLDNLVGSKDMLWIAFAEWVGVATCTKYPSTMGYVLDTAATANADGVGVAVAMRQYTSQTFDPPNFSLSAASSVLAITLGCYPTSVWVGGPVVSGDDGRRYSDTGWYAAGQSYEVGADAAGAQRHGFIRCPGNSLAPPQGAGIDAAYLYVGAVTSYSTVTCNLNLYLNDADNAVAPTSDATFDALALTSAVAWNAVAAMTSEYYYASPDIKAAVRAVVGRAGYAAGYALQVVVKNNGSSASARRSIGAVDILSGGHPSLIIAWSPPQTKTLDAAVRTRSGQNLTTTPGAVTKALDAATRSRAGQDVTATPGAVTAPLDAATRSRAAQDLTCEISGGGQPQIAPLDAAVRTRTPADLTSTGGPVTKPLDAAARVRAAADLTAIPGTVTKPLDAAARTRIPTDLTSTGGPVAKTLDAATRSRAAADLTSTPGTVTAPLDAAARSRTAQDIAAQIVGGSGQTANLDAAHRVRAAADLTPTGGPTTKALDAAQRSRAAADLTPTAGPVTVGLDPAQRSRGAADLAVLPGPTTAALDAGQRTRTPTDLTATPGPVSAVLDPAARVRAAADVAALPGLVTVPLDAAHRLRLAADLTAISGQQVHLDAAHRVRLAAEVTGSFLIAARSTVTSAEPATAAASAEPATATSTEPAASVVSAEPAASVVSAEPATSVIGEA